MPDNTYDIIVVGGGHAGYEAALATARMGMSTLLLTMNIDTVGQMSCNPAIGGLAKGQLVREIDALGGEMAKITDATGIQFRMLNRGRGPAVYGPRAQCDRRFYQTEARRRVEQQPGLVLQQGVVEKLVVDRKSVTGVVVRYGLEYSAKAVVLTTGTFLRGLIHMGTSQHAGGRVGESSAETLSPFLAELGLKLGRLKTGTPPRINGDSAKLDTLIPQHGDPDPVPFSFFTSGLDRPDIPCYLTTTNERTHQIILDNLDRAPLYSGQIIGTGPRYCPSIEDKVVRFSDKPSHQVFLEPEGIMTNEMYCNGIPTSLPVDVQQELVRSIAGLEEAEITRFGYAIEYDFVPPTQTRSSLESKIVDGLFLAGQINGTSGYEEAAAQGLMAGINAVLKLRGEPPFTLDRSEAFIGVLIDDLVTKGTEEPYRMFTSRAEHRLMLRQDNADRRLMPYGHKLGLIPESMWQRLQKKEQLIADTRKYLERKREGNTPLAQILRRPHTSFAEIERLDSELAAQRLPSDVKEQLEIEMKYAGYIRRQMAQIERFKRMESREIPPETDYASIKELSNEAQSKLAVVQPKSLGQASRISGVSPSDIAILMVHIQAGSSREHQQALPED